MGENVIITRENILFKSRFYDFVVSKETVTGFRVSEKQIGFGRAVKLEIRAEKIKIVFRFFVGRLVYWWHKLIALLTSGVFLPHVFGDKEKIERLLLELRSNGYQVETALTAVRLIFEADRETRELEMHCWSLVRRMIIWAFFSGILIFTYLFLICQIVLWRELFLLIVGWALTCRFMCYYLKRRKKN
ncbi:MAG TPA: hypothetical protein PLR18_02040 [bacterium]|nr:hypothetical protein [bacterium]